MRYSLPLILSEAAQAAEETARKIPLNGILFVVGIVLLAYFMMRITMRRVARSRQKSRQPIKDRIGQNLQSHTHESMSRMNELMASLADLSRQINGQIDTRLAKLQILIRDADRMIKRLEELIGKETTPAAPADKLSINESAESIRQISEDLQAKDDSTAVQNAHGEPVEHASTIKPPQDDFKNASDDHKPAELTGDARKVRLLADKGLSPIAIAQELDRPVGEIELMLALSGKKEDTTG